MENEMNRAAYWEYQYRNHEMQSLQNQQAEYQKETALMLFKGLSLYESGFLQQATTFLESYLQQVSSKVFDETCADSLYYQNMVRNILGKMKGFQ